MPVAAVLLLVAAAPVGEGLLPTSGPVIESLAPVTGVVASPSAVRRSRTWRQRR